MKTSVSPDRWQEAQSWELALWERQQRKRGWRRLVWPVVARLGPVARVHRVDGDDWNHWWAEQFDSYRFLPDDLGEYIELGCGPYTNTRLILRGRSANRVVCSDPLIHAYLGFRGRWLAESHRRGAIEVDDHPVEELPYPPESFDVVVMINVLDHVRDAITGLGNATALVRPGGYFVIGQDLTDEEDHARMGEDVGHPIRLTLADLEPCLAPFEPVLREVLPRERGRSPNFHCGTLVFGGRRGGR